MNLRLHLRWRAPSPPFEGEGWGEGVRRKSMLGNVCVHLRDSVGSSTAQLRNFAPAAHSPHLDPLSPKGERERAAAGRGARILHTLCAVTVLILLLAASPVVSTQPPPTDAEILALMKAHCVMCHAAEPTHPAFASAPFGVVLETIPQVAANAARIMIQVVATRAMPLGNETGMTDTERDRTAAWIEGRNR
jgi:mono/diheme cytochrome c family protein